MTTEHHSLVLSGDGLGLLGACLVHSNVPIPARTRLNRGPVVDRRLITCARTPLGPTVRARWFFDLLLLGLEGDLANLLDDASGASGGRSA